MKFEIVLATVGRTDEVQRFLESLATQSYRSFRLIVVDQNDDGRLIPLLERYANHVPFTRTTSPRGLSRARNAALRQVTGDVVAFADDDCWYPPDLLVRVEELLRSHPDWGGVTGRVTDESGLFSSARWSKQAGLVDRGNIWTRGVSISVFLRRDVVDAVGPFDETLGIGSGTDWGSGEETDFLLRALECGFRLHYEPALTVFHPQTRSSYTTDELAAGLSYGMGMGRVIRKHRYPWWFAGYHVSRAVGGAVISLVHGRVAEARFHLAVARGRAIGWLRSAAAGPSLD